MSIAAGAPEKKSLADNNVDPKKFLSSTSDFQLIQNDSEILTGLWKTMQNDYYWVTFEHFFKWVIKFS